MSNDCAVLSDILERGGSVHLVGIGGVSMCALAEVLLVKGCRVTGSDMQESPNVSGMRLKGIEINIGHCGALVTNQDAVIRSAAIKDDNPEITAAHAAGIPVLGRAQAWGCLMRRYEQVLCIAGTHGKTTTTGMAAHIAMAAGVDPTIMLGGELPSIGAGHRLGGDKLMVFESCEYCNSFLSFLPTVAVILNIEADHLDFFTGLTDIVDSFAAFASLTPKTGAVVVNGDDSNTMDCIRKAGLYPDMTSRRVIRFGLNPENDVSCRALRFDAGYASFDIWALGKQYARVKLSVPGEHNVLNALAAAAAAIALELPGSSVTDGLSSFTGAGRRFQRIGEYNGAVLIDDYAHHPTEVAATLKAARAMGYSRILCAFQPHTYSRTAALFDDFVSALRMADRVYIAEIYAAREKPTGLSSSTLADALPNAGFYDSLAKLEEAVAADAAPGDLVLALGAGNINAVCHNLINRDFINTSPDGC